MARFDRTQFLARVCVAAGLGVACFVVPTAGPHRAVVGAFLLLVVVPGHLVIRRLAGVPNPVGWLDLLAIAAGTVTAAIEPTLWPPALLFQMLTLGGVLAILRPRSMTALGVASVGSMAAVAVVHRIDGALSMVVVASLFLPVFISGSRRRAAKERRSTLRLEAAAQTLPMAVWEARLAHGHGADQSPRPASQHPPAGAAAERADGDVDPGEAAERVRLQAVVGRVEHLFGRSIGDLLHRGIAADVHPDDAAAYRRRFEADFDLAAAPELEYRYRHGDGGWVWLRDRLDRAGNGAGSVVRGVTVDITDVRASELDLRRQGRIVGAMAATTIVLERDVPDRDVPGRAVPEPDVPAPDALQGDPATGWVVVQVTDPLGLAGDRPVVRRPLAEAFPALGGDDAPVGLRRALHLALDRIGTGSDPAGASPGALGDVSPRRLGPWPIALAGRRRVGAVELEVIAVPGGARAILVNDVTEREEAAALLRHQASHDSLTGLENRAALHLRMEDALRDGREVGLVLVDLNDFKDVNDTLGHQVGDAYLRVIGGRLAALCRPGEHAVRLGGDEFALVVVEPGPDRLDRLADQVVASCHLPVELGNLTVAGSASAGIVCTGDLPSALGRDPAVGLQADALLRCADLAMYRAKGTHAGVCRYRSEMDRTVEQLSLVTDLQRAFERDEFVLHLQPKLDLATGRVVGAEGLVRWRHPALGVLEPSRFLDLLTVSGYADQLLQATLRRAAEALQRLPADIGLALNVMAHNVRNRNLTGLCQEVLARHGVDAPRLTIEITESQVLDTSGVVEAVMSELAAEGVRVSVDDFGTGYSSLTHLRALPLAELKIDRQFVDSILTSNEDLVIVRAMIELAHNLGLDVVAEGVEDLAVSDALRRLGCDQAQGFLWAAPRPLEEFLARLDIDAEGARLTPGWGEEELSAARR
ncbi:MAG: GGDEF and EAL domain-containing protein [Acidimicrobiales bacterium]|nr:GGDEF and EAL domain-containing protein [Acidimicrobiales bacterium]